jgi:hypothetical protein
MLALSEYLMREPLPLATVQEAILDFCRGRSDLCVFGAQALSRHTGVPRMTQDVDIMAVSPEAAADELASFLGRRFPHRMAARVRAVKRDGSVLGYRVFQQRSEELGGNRHPADIRRLDVPREGLETEDGIQYTGAPLTLAMKSLAATVRNNPIKRDQDRVDTMRLIVAMPDVSASDLEPLWSALHAPADVRTTFEQLRAAAAHGAQTDEDDFY